MPRYFMNVSQESDAIDPEGQFYSDIETARSDATAAALELIVKDVLRRRPVIGTHRVDIVDEAGQLCDTVLFSDVITVCDGPIHQ